MALWIEFNVELRDHWKIHRLKERLGIPYPHALGLMGCLWTWTAQHAPNGRIDRFTDAEISDAAKWNGDAKALREALKHAELEDADGKIHDWKQHGLRLLHSARKRLKRYRSKGGGGAGVPKWQNLRMEILKRDKHTCVYCAREAFVVDHVIPISKGGTSDVRNLVSSCKSCNAKKGNKTLSECGLQIIDENVKHLCNSYETAFFTNPSLPSLPFIKQPRAQGAPEVLEIPEDLESDRPEILRWLEYRREIGKRYKGKQGIGALWSQLRAIPADQRKAAIERSMAAGWTGVFPDKGGNGGRNQNAGRDKHPGEAAPVPGKYDD